MVARETSASSAQRAKLPVLQPGIIPAVGSPLDAMLHSYKITHGLSSKGQIATMVYASRLARESGLPFDVSTGIRTVGEGQVKGLGKASVQRILAEYGISKVLAKEGGRTSRGSLGNITNFLNHLNNMHAKSPLDTVAIEAWWIQQAKAFFNAKPFVLRFESGKSLRAVIRDLLAQAKKRQDETRGTRFVGAMLQHLVGAKLELALPNEMIEHNGFSVADEPGGRTGDFEVGTASIHVTTAPGEAVLLKCVDNLHAGRQPVIVTVFQMLLSTDMQAEEIGIADRVDILDAEQFIVANLHEFGAFNGDRRRVSVEALIDKYNEIIDAHETDPSLKISRG
jgi:hypothetical protein